MQRFNMNKSDLCHSQTAGLYYNNNNKLFKIVYIKHNLVGLFVYIKHNLVGLFVFADPVA